MSVKLLTEHHLEFLSLKGDCTGSSESTHVKMPHCWKSHALAHFFYKIEDKIKELDGVIAELERKRDEESGSVMKNLETALSENKKLEALAQSAVDNKKEGLKAENKRKKELNKNLNDVSYENFKTLHWDFPAFLKCGPRAC